MGGGVLLHLLFKHVSHYSSFSHPLSLCSHNFAIDRAASLPDVSAAKFLFTSVLFFCTCTSALQSVPQPIRKPHPFGLLLFENLLKPCDIYYPQQH